MEKDFNLMELKNMIKQTEAKKKSRCPNCGTLVSAFTFDYDKGNIYVCNCGEEWNDNKPGISNHLYIEVIDAETREILCDIRDFIPPQRGDIVDVSGRGQYEVVHTVWGLVRDDEDYRHLHVHGIIAIQVNVRKVGNYDSTGEADLIISAIKGDKDAIHKILERENTQKGSLLQKIKRFFQLDKTEKEV